MGGSTFETIEQLRQALLALHDTYNTIWLIKRHGSSRQPPFAAAT